MSGTKKVSLPIFSNGTSYAKNYLSIVCYNIPEWAKSLQNIPKEKLLLANLPTPIHKWKLPSLSNEFKLSIKRDDLTGCGLSGNKVRKLEFLLADAVTKGFKSVITCGSIQSNHCRATAVAARELDLDCHLLLRAEKPDITLMNNSGNLLPSLLCNCKIYFIPKTSNYLAHIKPKQEALAKEILLRTGHPAYCIPVGGSNVVGLYGYIEAWQELMDQQLFERFDDVVLACGSGGSVAGLTIGNFLTGQKIKLHAITVCDNKEYFYDHINEMLHEVGLTEQVAEDLVDIIDGYKGEGYGQSTPEDREFYFEIASRTGLFFDPVYTGKAVKGLLNETKTNPERFKGKRLLFIHTGGMFSLYDGTINEELQAKFMGKNTYVWSNDSMDFTNLFST